jgi:kinetochore protein NDC80
MRRTTLGPISTSQLNARSNGMGHPGASARVSVGAAKPPPVRQSIGPSTTRRVSTAARLPPQAPPRNSLPRQSVGSGRRSSAYGGGRMSMAGGGRTGRTDPRPLADKTFMNSCIQALIEFLGERQYDHALSPKILKGPSKKDFTNIIQFLFRQIDPTFEFGLKFEEDVAAQFKILKYPFGISKTALVAVGSPHTWPALLGSIAWIIELLSVRDWELWGSTAGLWGPDALVCVDIV